MAAKKKADNKAKDEVHAAKKAKTHTRYYDKAGKLVVGVTTCLNMMAKPALVPWANKLGLRGIDSRTYVDELALIGTLSHYMIECMLKDVKPNYGDFTPNQVSLAENSAIKFLQWQETLKSFELIASEKKVVNEEFGYGGTCDIFAKIDGRNTVLDIKTSKAIYSEAHTQVVAYAKALKEEGFVVDDIKVVRIGRNEEEGFEIVQVMQDTWDLHWNRFLACKKIYDINKLLK